MRARNLVIALIMNVGATYAQVANAAPLPPLPPTEIQGVCDGEKSKGPLSQRINNFWGEFERLFYSRSAPPEVRAALQSWPDVHETWKAAADASPGAARDAARAAWARKLATSPASYRMRGLARYQLHLITCFFPAANGFNAAEVRDAFEALALGTGATDPQNPLRGRMDDITGWMVWASFSEAAARASSADSSAWQSLERIILDALLVHAYHDSRSTQRRGLKPAGLQDTSIAGIRRFADSADVPAAILESYAQLKAGAPTLKDNVPQFIQIFGAKKLDAEADSVALRTRIADLEGQIGDLQLSVDAAKARWGYVVLAFFKHRPEAAQRAELVAKFNLRGGRTFGLPLPDHNWECTGPDCRSFGNQVFRTGYTGGKDPFPWEYIAARHFKSGRDAEIWLKYSEEGQFMVGNAEVVVTTVVTAHED